MPHTDDTILTAYHEAGHAVAALAQPGEFILVDGPSIDTTGSPKLGGNACHAGLVNDPGEEVRILLDAFKADQLTAEQVVGTVLHNLFKPHMIFSAGGLAAEKHARGLANPLTVAHRFNAVVGGTDDIAQINVRLALLGFQLGNIDLASDICREGLLQALGYADQLMTVNAQKLHAIAEALLAQPGPTLSLSVEETTRIYQSA